MVYFSPSWDRFVVYHCHPTAYCPLGPPHSPRRRQGRECGHGASGFYPVHYTQCDISYSVTDGPSRALHPEPINAWKGLSRSPLARHRSEVCLAICFEPRLSPRRLWTSHLGHAEPMPPVSRTGRQSKGNGLECKRMHKGQHHIYR